MKNSEKCDHNATEMRPSFISGEPLTLEQLRQMEKPTPVWAKPEKKTIEAWDGYWCICHRGHIITPGMVSMYADKMNGVTFYAYPPAHIAPEAWTPCEYCKDRHLEKVHVKTCGNGDMGISAEVGRVNREEKTGIVILQGFAAAGYVEFDFCPFCGRPQTSEARAMLEKRLRGVMICRCGI